MKNILFALLLLPFFGIAQRIQSPSWGPSIVYFETAKIKTHNSATKKYGPESYKTASITIDNANLSTPTVTVDIPDIFFLKQGETFGVSYKQSEDGSEEISYTIIDGDKMAIIIIMFRELEEKPYGIIVSILDNYKISQKSRSYALTEIK